MGQRFGVAERIKAKIHKTGSIITLAIAALMLPLAMVPGIAAADSTNINFQPPYVLGSINGQDGWTSTGAYDQAVVHNSPNPSGFGNQSFRISDKVTSGSFGDQTFSKPLTDSVGEIDSTYGTYSVVAKQRQFVMQFSIVSAVPGAQQPGMHVSVSPDRGDGSRMSFLRFEDGAAGLNVFFDDVEGTTSPANFVESQIATGLNRAVPHTVKLVLQTNDGPSNDVVKVWIDGNLVKTGTSWENYYRYDAEASAEQSPRVVKTVLFRESGTANVSDAGKGFLFDNLTTTSQTPIVNVTKPKITSPPNGSTLTTAEATHIDWTNSNSSAGGPITYQYRSYTDPNYSVPAFDSGPTLTASEIPTPGTPNNTYYVQVRAIDGYGNTSAWSNDASNPYKITVADPNAPPTHRSQCDNDGWLNFNNPVFNNRGDCRSYVNHHNHQIKGDVKYTAYGLKRHAQFHMNVAGNHGSFKYSDANGDWYKVNVNNVSVSGNNGYFAGTVTSASQPSWVGNTVFAKVQDSHPDQIWGSFTTPAAANAGVVNMTNPADGPFAITQGNLEVN